MPPSSSTPQIFDRTRLRKNRDKASAQLCKYEYLLRRAEQELLERVINDKGSLERVLILGAADGKLGAQLHEQINAKMIVSSDLSWQMIKQCAGCAVQLDEEQLPFAHNSFDVIIAPLTLHLTNKFPNALRQINQSLKKGGRFYGAIIGGESLFELKDSLMRAELELRQGACARVAPTISMADLGTLLQTTGFHNPIVDCDYMTVTYKDVKQLLEDLKHMGMTSILQQGAKGLMTPNLLGHLNLHYSKEFQAENSKRILARFELIYLFSYFAG